MITKPSLDSAGWHSKIKKLNHFAWLMWGTAMAAQLLNTFNRVGASPAVDQIMAEFGITAVTWGGLMSMYFYIYALMQFPSGIMADKLEPRKTITIGCFVAFIGTVIFGLAPSLLALYIGRFLISLGISVFYVSTIRIAVDWFKSRHFAKMVGLNGFLSTVGSLVGTTPMAILIQSAGWRWSFEILAIVNLIIFLASWFILRNKPADMGLPSPAEAENQIRTDDIDSTSKAQPTIISLRKSIARVFISRHTWATFMCGSGLYGTVLVFVGAWGIPYAMQVYGMTRAMSANIMSLMLVSHAIGIIAIPFISDGLKRRKPVIVASTCIHLALMATLLFSHGGKPPPGLLTLIFILMGLTSAATTLGYVVTKENLPTSISGIALGVVNMSPFLSAAIFQLLVGLVLDASWQGDMAAGVRIYPLTAYRSAFMLLLLPTIAAVVGSFLMRETHCRDISST